MVRTLMGHVNRPVNASTALLASTALESGTLGYGSVGRSGTTATYTDPYGVVRQAAANTPRVNNSDLVATNYVNNPRMLNGTSTTSPTTWGMSWASPTTRTLSYGVGADGNEYTDVRLVSPGGVNSTLVLQLYWEATRAIRATVGTTVTSSAVIQLIAGSLPGNFQMMVVELDDVGGNPGYRGDTGRGLPTTPTRHIQTVTPSLGTTAAVHPGLWIYTNDVNMPFDFTIRVSQPSVVYGSTYTGFARGPAGVTVGPHAAYTKPRLLVEEGRTNIVINPRFEGAVVGDTAAGGSVGSDWAPLPGNTIGMTREVLGFGTLPNGLPYIDFRISGTPTSSTGQIWNSNALVGTLGDTYSTQAWIQLLAGSMTNVNAGGLTLRVGGEGGTTTVVPTSQLTKYTNVRALATGTNVSWTLRWNYTDLVTPVDFSVRVAGVQCELGAFPTSLILPAVGTPVAAVRNNDDVVIPTAGTLKFDTPVTNLAIQSSVFSTNWTVPAASLTANATLAPDGTTTGYKLVEGVGTVSPILRYAPSGLYTPGTTYTASVYAKAGERSAFTLLVLHPSGGTSSWMVDLATGTIDVGSTSVVSTGKILNVGSGWYRISVSFTAAGVSAGGYFDFRMSDTAPSGGLGSPGYAGDGVSGMFFWGPQLEVVPSAAIQTNIIPSPELFNSFWGRGAVTVTQGSATAPDGYLADKIVEDATTAQHMMAYNVGTAVIGSQWTISVYAKAAERSVIALTFTGEIAQPSFDLIAGTVSGAIGVESSITDVGNGWWRCVSTFTRTTTGNTAYIGLVNFGSRLGTVGSGVYLWGAMVTQTGTPSEYIPVNRRTSVYVPTGATTVTKTKLAPGTIVISAKTNVNLPPTGNPKLLTIDEGSAANRLYLFQSNTNHILAGVIVHSTIVNNTATTTGPITPGTPFKVAVAWDGVSYYVCRDGGAVGSNATPVPLGLTSIKVGGGTSYWNGEIESVVYYPYAMSTSQLQAATA